MKTLAVGVFDGVHRGHQALLKEMRRYGQTTVITFTPHPAFIVKGQAPPLLCTLEERVNLLYSFEADQVLVWEFTEAIQKLSPQEFLESLIKEIDFDLLVLGYDTHIGRGREGTPEMVSSFLKEQKKGVIQVPAILDEGLPISSSRIRRAIEEGHLDEVKGFLGRPWSIQASPQKGLGLGKLLGAPTFNFSVEGLVKPPYGVYTVFLDSYKGVANLGTSPTIKKDPNPLLEVHLLENCDFLPNPPWKITPLKFLREEQSFSSPSELKKQIDQDIKAARFFFDSEDPSKYFI